MTENEKPHYLVRPAKDSCESHPVKGKGMLNAYPTEELRLGHINHFKKLWKEKGLVATYEIAYFENAPTRNEFAQKTKFINWESLDWKRFE